MEKRCEGVVSGSMFWIKLKGYNDENILELCNKCRQKGWLLAKSKRLYYVYIIKDDVSSAIFDLIYLLRKTNSCTIYTGVIEEIDYNKLRINLSEKHKIDIVEIRVKNNYVKYNFW